MRITIIPLALLCAIFLLSNANAQGCPSGQYAHGRCIEGPPKAAVAKPAMRRCPGGRYMGRCIQ
jgi:hypothetical protein